MPPLPDHSRVVPPLAEARLSARRCPPALISPVSHDHRITVQHLRQTGIELRCTANDQDLQHRAPVTLALGQPDHAGTPSSSVEWRAMVAETDTGGSAWDVPPAGGR